MRKLCQAVENPVRKVLEEGFIVGLAKNTILIGKDGVERPIDDSGAPIRDVQGHVYGVVLVFRDVAERRRAEQTRARLASIVESSDDAILARTLDGIITDWSPGAERMCGFAASEIVGKSIEVFMPADRAEELDEINQKLLRGEPTRPFETVRLSKDGKRMSLSVSVSPIRNKARPGHWRLHHRSRYQPYQASRRTVAAGDENGGRRPLGGGRGP